jgi:hypothetical protein
MGQNSLERLLDYSRKAYDNYMNTAKTAKSASERNAASIMARRMKRDIASLEIELNNLRAV